jgi:hypothetical protein
MHGVQNTKFTVKLSGALENNKKRNPKNIRVCKLCLPAVHTAPTEIDKQTCKYKHNVYACMKRTDVTERDLI